MKIWPEHAVRRSRLWMVLAVPFVLLLAAFSLSAFSSAPESSVVAPGSPVVVTVNGEPLETDEFAQALLRERALVVDYFAKKYGVSEGKGFWTKRVGSETPLEQARARALTRLIRLKVEQKLASQVGLDGDLSYRKLKSDLERENTRRAGVVARGGVIYGPIQYDEAGYLDYRQSNLVQAHLRLLASRPRTLTELTQFYERFKAQFYQQPSVRRGVELWTSKPSPAARAATLRQIVQARSELQAGVSPSELAQRLKLELRRFTLDRGTARGWSMSRPVLLEQATLLNPGEVSPVLEQNSTFFILQVLEQTPGAVLPLSRVQDDVRLKLAQQDYRQAVEHEVRSAQVVVQRVQLERVGESWWKP